jgi:hypothetical protein
METTKGIEAGFHSVPRYETFPYLYVLLAYRLAPQKKSGYTHGVTRTDDEEWIPLREMRW